MIVVRAGEYPIQCRIIEDGVQCGNGSRTLSERLCNKHARRYSRTGTYHRRSSDERRRELKEAKRLEEGQSIICACTHKFSEHKNLPKNGGNQRTRETGKCCMQGCKCWSFSGVNIDLATKTLPRLHRLGFVPINKNMLCLHCNECIDAGWWYDPIAIIRIREHLKKHLVSRATLTA